MTASDICEIIVRIENGDTDGAISRLKEFLAKPEDAGAVVAAARKLAHDELEIDDAPLLSDGEDGCWVSAWVWVPREAAEEIDGVA